MAQNRHPPAYQEYSAAMIANREFRLMSLAERGLLYSMRLECWENHTLPSQPAKLAKYLGFQEEEIKAALPAVLPFFKLDDEGFLYSPELEDYRKHLEDRLAKQAAGGKRSAENKKKRGNPAETGPADRILSHPRDHLDASSSRRSKLQATCKVPASNLEVLSTAQLSPGQHSSPPPGDNYSEEGNGPDKYFGAADYDRASNGG